MSFTSKKHFVQTHIQRKKKYIVKNTFFKQIKLLLGNNLPNKILQYMHKNNIFNKNINIFIINMMKIKFQILNSFKLLPLYIIYLFIY